MIVFGTAVTKPEIYDRFAKPGIRQVAEPDSIVLAHGTAGSLFRNYNVLLDKASAHEGLEALVLLHQDCELVDSDFVARVREVLSDPEVAIVGCVGAVGVRSIAWWQGVVTWAAVTHRYEEFGGGEFPGPTWHPEKISTHTAPGEVDSIDGFVMVLSPWAVRNLRFDESLGKLHGYDFDICMQAKAAGKKVFAADFRAIHHHSVELIRDPEAWIATYITLVEKWDGLLPDTGASPERRALRAEAEAACARAIMVSHQYRATAIRRALDRANRALEADRERLAATTRELETANERLTASAEELERTKAKLEDVLTSQSWRVTEPLRGLTRVLRRSRSGEQSN
jgi:Glycosyltransferase like family